MTTMDSHKHRISRHDLIVIGAGPAGASAALAAAAHGLNVALLDEADEVGGQIYRAPAPYLTFANDHDPDRAAGDALRESIARSTVTWRPGLRVWSVGGRFRVDTAGPDGHQIFEAPRLIAATGAHERVVPFPDWTLPGIIGLAAATILLKSQAMLPGRSIVVAGCGPLLVAVAGKIARLGGEIVAVVDLASRRDWLRAGPSLLHAPRLLRQGIGWTIAIRRKRVPVYFGHGIRRADGDGRLARVTVGPVDRDGAPRDGMEHALEADALAVGHGLIPGGEIPRLFRAKEIFDSLRGGWVPQLDAHGRTSVPGLYAAGDGAGMRGAPAATIGGELAGLAAAHDADALLPTTHETLARKLLRQFAAAQAFSDAVCRLMALRPGHVGAIPPDTVICRCEDVLRRDIDAAVAAGARDVNQMKHFTRCGMGPCQGRMCGDVAAELVAQKAGLSREAVGVWTGRPPLRPVPLGDLLGDFDYGDIPIPQPAPL